MAGIGFQLRKLAQRETLSAVMSASGHAAVIAAGPWLFTILSLAAIGITTERLVGLDKLAEFRVVIVMGELLWLRDLAVCLPVLDAYEGGDYARVQVQVEHVGGPSWAWIYVLADPRVTALGTRVPGGEWIAQRHAEAPELGAPSP